MKKATTAFEKHREKRDRRVVQLIEKGMTRDEIAKQFKITVERIRQIAKENGVDTSRPESEFKPIVIRLLKKGKTFNQIADELNLSYNQVNYIGHIAGIESPYRAAIFNRNKLIVKLLKQGVSRKQIADRFNLTRDMVGGIANRNGLYRSNIKRKKVEELIKKGLKNFEIARKLGMSNQLVSHYRMNQIKTDSSARNRVKS